MSNLTYEIKADAINVKALEPGPVVRGPELTTREQRALELAYDLLWYPPASWLVTGYRGVGKSTLVNQVIETLKDMDDGVVVVRVNGAVGGKSEDLSRYVLRKLQRNLYLELRTPRLLGAELSVGRSRPKTQRPLWHLLPPKLQTELQLAYRQTLETTKDKTIKTKDQGIEFGFEYKNWPAAQIGTALVTISAFSFVQAFTNWLTQWLSMPDWLAKLTPAIGGIIVFGLPKFKHGSSTRTEQEVAPLYDDEVAAETFNRLIKSIRASRLEKPQDSWVLQRVRSWNWVKQVSQLVHSWNWVKRVLQRVRSWNWVKLVLPKTKVPNELHLYFVIDELDKLSPNQMDDVLRGLKTVLLSGEAQFVLVSGMSDFYRWHQALANEDDLFVNVFTYHRHIQAMNGSDMARLVQGLLVDPSSFDTHLQRLSEHLTIRSRARPRQFLMELSTMIKWEPPASLVIPGGLVADLGFRTKLYAAVADAWATADGREVHDGIKDMLRAMTALWADRVVRHVGGWSRADIFLEQDYEEDHHRAYRQAAEAVWESFIQGLVSEEVIEYVSETDQYRWRTEDQVRALISSPELESSGPDAVLFSEGDKETTGISDNTSKVGQARLEETRRILLDGVARLSQMTGLDNLGTPEDTLTNMVQEGYLIEIDITRVRQALEQANPRRMETALRYLYKSWVGRFVAREMGLGQAMETRVFGDQHQPDMTLSSETGVVWLELTDGSRDLKQRLMRRFGKLSFLAADHDGPAEVIIVVYDLLGTDQLVSRVREIVFDEGLGMPFPVRIVVVVSLNQPAISAGLAQPVIVPEKAAPRGFRAVSRPGYIYLEWEPQRDASYRIGRSNSPGDEPVKTKVIDQAQVSFDFDVEPGVRYYYRLVAAGVNGLSAPASADARADRTLRPFARDVLDWRAELERASLLPVVDAEKDPDVVPVSGILDLLEARLRKRTGRPLPIVASMVSESLGLFDVKGVAVTELGKKVVDEAVRGKWDTLLLKLIYHPATRQALIQLREHKQFLASDGDELIVADWLRFIAEKTGALCIDGPAFSWKYPW